MDVNRFSPSYGLTQKHITRLSDFSTEDIFEILYATKAMKAKFAAHEDTRILNGATVALLFADTSLRTRCALEIGIRQLGGVCVNLPYSENDMRAGENFRDIVNVIARYGVGALVTRGVPQEELFECCAVSDISILNSSNEHAVPAQALCDLYTIWEKKGKLEGVKLAYVGKGTPTAASLITGAVKCGMEVAVATPEKYGVSESTLDAARQYGDFTTTVNPVEAVRGADIVYTDSYGYHENVPENVAKALLPYQVNNSLMSYAAHNACVMHPLPAKRGIEVTAEIIDGKNSLVLEQGENKLHTIKSVLALLVK